MTNLRDPSMPHIDHPGDPGSPVSDFDPRSEVLRISRLLGHAPDPTTRREGAGLLGVVATIHADVQEIKETFSTMVTLQNRRRALAWKLGFTAFVPIFGAVVAAVVHYLEAFRR